MTSDSQNRDLPTELPSPTEDDELSQEKKSPPPRISYYYDDATGYEVYQDADEAEEEKEPVDEES